MNLRRRFFLNLYCTLALMIGCHSWIVTAVPHKSRTTPRLLSLTGQVIEGDITDDGSESIKVTMKLRVEIKNIGSKPALILDREPDIVDSRFIEQISDAAKETYLFRMQSLPSIGRDSQWERIQMIADKPKQPTELIRKLQPNETWTFELTNWFHIGKKDNIDPNSKSWVTVRQASPVWHQITLKLWSRDIESNADRTKLSFSKMLQKRWRKFGELQLEDLTSDPIPVDFSFFTLNKNQ